MSDHSSQELVIIGAPRSGTNMLRDVLCRLEGFGTWPCDEINYIWRHGNARWPSDALPPSRATDRVKRYIRKAFARRRQLDGSQVVVEKTCASSLRVPFIDRVLPDARYVFIHRDPIDAVASAKLRWHAPFELSYTLSKARFVPVSDLPFYGARFLANRLHRLVSREGRLAFWGPRLEDMNRVLRQHTLTEVCALQWSECVRRSAEAFSAMPQAKFQLIAYEQLVASPATGLATICRLLGQDPGSEALKSAVEGVTARNVGKGHEQLSDEEKQAVRQIAQPAMEAIDRLYDVIRTEADETTPGTGRNRRSSG